MYTVVHYDQYKKSKENLKMFLLKIKSFFREITNDITLYFVHMNYAINYLKFYRITPV